MTPEAIHLVKALMGMLAHQDYHLAAQLTSGVRLTAEQMESAVRGYGRTLLPPPDDFATRMDVVMAGHTAMGKEWSVTVPLFTAEEGRSDLSLVLTVREKGEVVLVEPDDIRVL